MKKVLVFCLLLALWPSLDGSSVWAFDVGWMQKGVRVWYFGAAGTGMSSNAEEAYLFASINGNTAQLTHHSGINYWSLPTAATETGSILDKGPFWIHPQVLQTIAIGDNWMGIDIASMNRATYTYDTFINNDEFSSIPYLLLPIKALFDLKNQREVVKLVYGIPYPPYNDPVWGTAYFDAETGLCLFNLKLTVSNTVFFILSEINYNFATHRAFAEDNGPHTGFKSNAIKSSTPLNLVDIEAYVESRYGNTVQMWASTQLGGSISSIFPFNENYCFFGSVPVLRHKLMAATPNYPPENWNQYGEYLWWWVPTDALQKPTINVFGVPMTKTSTAPYTFTGTGGTGLYFSEIIFDNDGYMTSFCAKYPSIGLDLCAGFPLYNNTTVDGLDYYRNTMGIAKPAKLEMVDFDGDRKTDITIYRSSTGVWWITPSSGAPAHGHGWGGPGFKPVPGDYDGDGKTDIAIYDTTGGAWWIIPSSGIPAYGVGWGGSTFKPLPGDYDGDAKTDIAIYDTTGGAWWIIPSSGTGPQGQVGAYGVGWGGSAFKPVPGDYDGDGKTDIAIYNTATGAWWIIPSSGTGPQGQVGAYGVGWGGSAFKPVPGDYDGDGKTDIAIYNTATGAWWIIPSSGTGPQGQVGAYGLGWGGSGFTPVPGDYEGDGKTDVAIYQSSNGGWWIIYSSDGSTHGMGWGGDASDVPLTTNPD